MVYGLNRASTQSAKRDSLRTSRALAATGLSAEPEDAYGRRMPDVVPPPNTREGVLVVDTVTAALSERFTFRGLAVGAKSRDTATERHITWSDTDLFDLRATWPIYRVSQAPVHASVMSAFGRHLARNA
jgi:hypothetical protein